MTEILSFVFTNFWTFIGSLMLITAITGGIANIFRSIAMMIHGVPESAFEKKQKTTVEKVDEKEKVVS